MDWKSEITFELVQAQEVRERGNEGQARVRARRAAGTAIREYYRRAGDRLPSRSVYDLLRKLAADPAIAPDIQKTAGYLTMRVTETFTLPVDVDLIVETQKLVTALLPDYE